ncbi:putative membrane protein [Microbacterium proteolyticum]|nr:putative membrane protein [Microbacterium sp. SORGH_AS_0344]MDQ1168531.1 putative membrane protein [Microbacterium proteolyticum]
MSIPALRFVDPAHLRIPRFGGLSRRLAGLPSLHVGAAVLSVLLGGLLLSIATTRDPLWWHLHFSQLGIFGDLSSALFNTTLKVSGAMVVVFALFVRRDILRLGRGPVRRGSATLACVCLNVVGINLALVGCVPLNTDKDLHDRVAGMMVLGFLALLVSAPIMLRRLGARMTISTGVALVWLVMSITLFVTATINLALFETISCGAMFAWSGMLTHTLGNRTVLKSAAAEADVRAACAGGRRVRRSLPARRRALIARVPRPSQRPRIRSTALTGRAAVPLTTGASGHSARAASARSAAPDPNVEAATETHRPHHLITRASTVGASPHRRRVTSTPPRPSSATHPTAVRSEVDQCCARKARRVTGCSSSCLRASSVRSSSARTSPTRSSAAGPRAARRARRRSLAPSTRL